MATSFGFGHLSNCGIGSSVPEIVAMTEALRQFTVLRPSTYRQPAFVQHLEKAFGDSMLGRASDELLDRLQRLWDLGATRGRGECCEDCGALEGVRREFARTGYSWDGVGEDPNRNPHLCRTCAVEHHAYWDAMWEEVRWQW